MYQPSTIPYQQHRSFRHTFKAGHLTLGLFFPIEAFQGDMPTMLHQAELAHRAEELGFSTLWFRDVPLRDSTRHAGPGWHRQTWDRDGQAVAALRNLRSWIVYLAVLAGVDAGFVEALPLLWCQISSRSMASSQRAGDFWTSRGIPQRSDIL